MLKLKVLSPVFYRCWPAKGGKMGFLLNRLYIYALHIFITINIFFVVLVT